jgi:hypothetical protein
LSLVLNEGSLFINWSSLLLACLFLFTGCAIWGWRVLLLISILGRPATEGRVRLKFRGAMGVRFDLSLHCLDILLKFTVGILDLREVFADLAK